MQYFRKNRQNSEKIEKNSEKYFQEFGKILVGLKKKGGFLLQFREEKSEKKY